MNSIKCFLASSVLIAITSLSCPIGSAADQWPQFRGPSGDGIVHQQSPPIEFGESSNVTWKTELQGKGWSSPVIADSVVYMTTAVERVPTDEERIEMLRESGIEEKKFKQLAIAKSIGLKLITVDLETGELTETVDLAEVKTPDAIHTLNSYASPTPVIDGETIICHFGTYGTFCLNRTTFELIWERVLPLEHSVGPGSSPFIDGDSVVLIQDGVDRQYVTALDKATGKSLWETERPEMDAPTGDQKKAYCTPISVVDKTGRRQLICMGSQWIVAYQAETGSELWRLRHGKGFSVVPRPVAADDVVYFSTGFGKPQLWAVRIDGSGDVTDTHVEWTVTKGIPAKPSPILDSGLIYVVDDNGVASCFSAADGEEQWKTRLGGKFSASPVLAGGHLYFGNHEGEVTVVRPGREVEIVVKNSLDGQIMASPAVVDDALIVRTDHAIYRIDAPQN